MRSLLALSLLLSCATLQPAICTPLGARTSCPLLKQQNETVIFLAAADKTEDSDKKNSSDDKKSAGAEKKTADADSDSDKPRKKSFGGNASWYGIPFHGKKTASGEVFNMNKCSAAHLTLPLPTKVLVEYPRTGNAVLVKVNDRGPYVKTRVMDLSREAARELGTLPHGVAYVDITVLESPIRKKKTQ